MTATVGIIKCKDCGRLGVVLNSIRLTRHKCAGQWFNLTSEEVKADTMALAMKEECDD